MDDTYNGIQYCNIPCNQCFKYLHINLDDLTMNTSISISSITSPFPSDSSCKCPAFSLNLYKNNYFDVFDSSQINFIGTLKLSTDNIKLQINNWLFPNNPCIQYYVPNTNDFMTIQSYLGRS